MLSIRVLGPVEARRGDQLLDLGRPRQRLVLAVLACEAGQPVANDVLIDRVWGAGAPGRAVHSLYVYIARLRRALGDDVLRRDNVGYRLWLEPESVDVQHFRGLVRQARQGEELDGRERLLTEALALWRGRPLDGLEGEWVDRVRQSCEGLWVEATVAWGQARLRQGRAETVLEPIAAALQEQPLVEPLAAVLMMALHEVGRTAEALELFASVRTRLSDELGTDPGRDLMAVHRAVLSGAGTGPADADVSGGAAAGLSGGAAAGVSGGDGAVAAVGVSAYDGEAGALVTVPAQLPLDVPGFAGRAGQLSQLDDTGTGVVVISGTAGVGKTSLALHWAHRAKDRFPDGQLYVNLRGFEPKTAAPLDPARAVAAFLEALGIAAERIPVAFEAQVGLYRSLLANRRVLVVLDNANGSEQVASLLPGGAGCVAVVTSRNSLSGLVTGGARLITLEPLSPPEARQMLEHRLGSPRIAAQPEAVDDIIDRCARLPLALAIATARALTYPERSLAVLAEGLASRLDAFSAGEPSTDIRTVFSWSVSAVSAPAAELFRVMGVHPGPSVSVAAAANLAGVDRAAASQLLEELARANLVSEREPGRYWFHDLLRAYALELTDGQVRRGASRRLLDYYLHSSYKAALLLDPHRTALVLDPANEELLTEELSGLEAAHAWFVTERSVLLSAIEAAQGEGMDRHAWQLAWTLADFYQREGHWAAWTSTQRIALAAVRRLGDQAGLARLCLTSARALSLLGEYEEAVARIQQALELFREQDDLLGEGHSHLGLGWVYERQGRFEEAITEAGVALAKYQALGHEAGQAFALNNLASHHTQVGKHGEAITLAETALRLHERSGNERGQADTLDTLGQAHHGLGDFDAATEHYAGALEINRGLHDRFNEADVFGHLGDTRLAAGDVVAARESLMRAWEILSELGHPDAARLETKLRDL
ncbi:MAG TPA: BTAD domain-containing putative transcriptional regulator [Candidatus Limnocylindrales bacterium]|nr:BTAD domain-containing putative transcriptional regulator [Candidatus Limnocylindrales bacterium]